MIDNFMHTIINCKALIVQGFNSCTNNFFENINRTYKYVHSTVSLVHIFVKVFKLK